jgi:threonine/homoserine/homoserine lactone efflux protein
MDALTALVAGLLAGLGIAVPLGAIAVLLIGEGVAHGFRAGAAGALAVGTVDTLYCTAAILLGQVAAPVITSWGAWPARVGGTALVAISAFGLWRTLTASRDGEDAGPPAGSPWRRFALFLGLTAINPATLIYFAAITVGLAHLLQSPLAAGLFIAGVGTASISWQLLVVAGGALLRGRLTSRARRVTGLVGNVIIAALGIAMIVQSLV